eukprot:3495193-Amphidinium_carterae.1
MSHITAKEHHHTGGKTSPSLSTERIYNGPHAGTKQKGDTPKKEAISDSRLMNCLCANSLPQTWPWLTSNSLARMQMCLKQMKAFREPSQNLSRTLGKPLLRLQMER